MGKAKRNKTKKSVKETAKKVLRSAAGGCVAGIQGVGRFAGVGIPIVEDPTLSQMAQVGKMAGYRYLVPSPPAGQAEVTQPEKPAVATPPPGLAALLKEMAVNVWRLKNKMTDVEGNVKDDFSRLFRHVEALEDGLKQYGIVVVDWVGRIWDDGCAGKVVGREPRADCKPDEVVETITPEIRWVIDDKTFRLAEAEVIVAEIEEKNEKDASRFEGETTLPSAENKTDQ